VGRTIVREGEISGEYVRLGNVLHSTPHVIEQTLNVLVIVNIDEDVGCQCHVFDGCSNLSYNNNNNIYFAKGQVHQKGKSPSKLATILRATKEKTTTKTEKNYAINI